MQSLLYLIEDGDAHYRKGDLGQALKKYQAIHKVYDESDISLVLRLIRDYRSLTILRTISSTSTGTPYGSSQLILTSGA
jgi:hypothetical protein